MVLPDPTIANPEKYNSPNHLFDGQNVAFADTHVEFFRRPDMGQSNENIWTQTTFPQGRITETPIFAGELPNGPLVPTSPFDTVVVPTRTAKGDLK
jgi:prepilin-type processing-associated H-X9-DG protein